MVVGTIARDFIVPESLRGAGIRPGQTSGPAGVANIVNFLNQQSAAQRAPFAAQLPQSQEQAVVEANQANEKRRADIENIFDQMLGELGILGTTRRADINESFDTQQGQLTQSLIDRGLLNSTTAATLPSRVEERRERSLTDLEESLAVNRIGVLGDRAGFLERVTDTAPTLESFFNRQAAAASAPSPSFGIGRTSGGGGGNRFAVAGGGTPGTDFAGRGVQPFGQLVRTGPRNNTTSNVNTTSVSSNERQRAIKALADRGVFTAGFTNDQINRAISGTGIVINSAADVGRLSNADINKLKDALRR